MVKFKIEFVLIENQYGNFYFSVIKAENIEDAYERAETMASSPGLHYIVPFNDLKKFILSQIKPVHKSVKGGG